LEFIVRKLLVSAITAAALAFTFTAGTAVPAVAQNSHYSFGSHNHGQYDPHGSYAYYNNYRGDRYQRPGFRFYQGYWFPAAAFLGFLLNGATHNSYQGAHFDWCYDRYRSYRASDNTFQPYHGPRQQCLSPYDH
jgi:hypothetical protein